MNRPVESRYVELVLRHLELLEELEHVVEPGCQQVSPAAGEAPVEEAEGGAAAREPGVEVGLPHRQLVEVDEEHGQVSGEAA